MSLESEERESIRTLYELYQHDVYRFGRYTLGDSFDASDVVQEVFLRAIRSWSSYRHEANPKTWLLTIARNYMNDIMRKQKRLERLNKKLEPPFMEKEPYSIDTAMILEESLLTLKHTYKEVFVLRHIENLSVQEVAKVLGWSPGKVRMTDHRAIAKLREVLGSDLQEVSLRDE